MPGMIDWMPIDVPRGGNRRERVLVDDLLRPRALHVDDRRLTGHRDRFLERADFQVEVHRGHEVPRQLDAFAFECGEALQRRRHRVRARPQIHDAILAVGVGDDRTDLFNQYRAGGFDCGARQHPSRGVSHDACDRRLCIGCRR